MRKSKTILLAVTTAAAFTAMAFVAPDSAQAGAAADVSAAEMAGMRPLYAVTGGGFDFNSNYNLDNSGTIASGSFDRVAYYVELSGTVNAADHRWVWVSMDAFKTDPTKVGVPKAGTGIIEQGTVVTNLHVETNHPNVTAGTSAYGDIEFWASNYDPNGGALGSDNNRYDWKDGGERNSNGGHGSFQTFALTGTPAAGFTNGKTLFGVTGGGGAGIGDQPNNGDPNTQAYGSPDWTFGPGTGSYAVRNLEIFVNTVPEPTSLSLIGLGGLALLRRRRNV